MVRRFRCSEWDEGMIERDDGGYVLFEDYATLEAENADLKRRLDIAKGELCRIHNEDLGQLSGAISETFSKFWLRKHHDITRALQGEPPKERKATP